MAGNNNSNTNRKAYHADSVYIDGNTVRRAQTAPKRQPEPPKKTRRQIEEERARKQAANRNLNRAMALGRGYIAFLTFATAVCFFVCVTLIYLQSDVAENKSAISTMEAAVSNQKAANDLAESRLETSMTLDEVKARAEEMGLIYPTTSQIQYFSVESSDYMNQYTDVASR